MIQVVAKQHTEGEHAGKWDLYVHDRTIEGDVLLSSKRGYETRGLAEHVADRLFGQRVGVDLEHVDLLVLGANGKGSHRMLR